ncbi:MAG: NAD(P)H-binding protein [Gemmatimonadaceae bacterium]|nr:NAD(P)H-binding protein [Gemmatimonadaceae bacterium]
MPDPQSTVRAFVAGATGYVGRHVVPALRARGVEVHAHVRPDSAQLERWRAAFAAQGAITDTTPWTPDAMRATMARVAPVLVFALLGTTRARVRASATRGVSESYEAVDYGLTHLLLEAARVQGPPPRFVYLSAVGVRPGVRNPYLAARAKLEGELGASGCPHLIAQPAYITGADREESRPVERGVAAVLDGVMSLLAAMGMHALAGRYRTLSGPELAKGLVELALAPGPAALTVDARALRLAAGPPLVLGR